MARFQVSRNRFDTTPVGAAIEKIAMKLLKEAYFSAPDKNVVISPLSVMTLLSFQNKEGFSGCEEIGKLLGAGNYEQLIEANRTLNQKYGAMDPSYLTDAKKVYVGEQYKLTREFSHTAAECPSEVDHIDFSNPKVATAVINQWAHETSKGHIKNLVEEEAIKPDITAALFNVLFFQGHFHVPFEVFTTKEKEFHLDPYKKVMKPTMHLLQALRYNECKSIPARMIELPYKEEGFRMIVVLGGLRSVMERVEFTSLLREVSQLRASERRVDLHLPRFEVEWELDLRDVLSKIGVSSIFTEPPSEIVDGEAVKLTHAFQKVVVKVNEEDASPGGFTGGMSMLMSTMYTSRPPIRFHVDHPFLYLILHEDKILLAGVITH